MVAETLRMVRAAAADLEADDGAGSVAATLHTVRGTAANFGLMAIADATRAPGVERAAPAGPDAADALRRAVARVEADLQSLWGVGWDDGTGAGTPPLQPVTP